MLANVANNRNGMSDVSFSVGDRRAAQGDIKALAIFTNADGLQWLDAFAALQSLYVQAILLHAVTGNDEVSQMPANRFVRCVTEHALSARVPAKHDSF